MGLIDDREVTRSDAAVKRPVDDARYSSRATLRTGIYTAVSP